MIDNNRYEELYAKMKHVMAANDKLVATLSMYNTFHKEVNCNEIFWQWRLDRQQLLADANTTVTGSLFVGPDEFEK